VLESHIERKFRLRAAQNNILALKQEIKGKKGYPDRLCLKNNGTVFYVELKRIEGTLSEHQIEKIDFLKKMGFRVYVPFTLEEAYKIIATEVLIK